MSQGLIIANLRGKSLGYVGLFILLRIKFSKKILAGGVARKTLFLHAQQCEHEEKGSAATGPRNHRTSENLILNKINIALDCSKFPSC